MIADLTLALRLLRKNPLFAVAAILTLAIGIGGNAAMFTVVRAVLLKPLEYRDPDQLVYFYAANPGFPGENPFALDRLEQMRDGARSFAGIGAFLASPESMTLSGGGEPESLRASRVSADFLDILGVRPILGRGFIAEEDARGGPSVAIISERLWRRRFSADPAIVGKTITLEATPHTVVGVMPAGFEFPLTGSDVWLPRPSEWSRFAGTRFFRVGNYLTGFARMKPGVTLTQARAEMDLLSQHHLAEHPEQKGTMRVELLKDRLVSNVRVMLWTLFGAVGFVLLIACANVASLMLARATSRQREFAVRAALGAAPGRIIRQLLAESVLLAVAGGVIGVWLASYGLRAVTLGGALSAATRARPLSVPGAGELHVDAGVLAFSILVAVATGVLFGLFPSLQASRPDLADVLRESGASAGRSSRRGAAGLTPRGLLVVGQVALSIILLIGAALLLRSFVRLRGVDPGFQPANVLTMKIALPPARYDTDQKKFAFFRDVASRAERVAGVRVAAVAMSLPATTIIRTNVWIQGRPMPDYSDRLNFGVVEAVTPGYFKTLGIPLRRGRDFNELDDAPGAPPVMIINEHFARRFWPEYPRGIDPVGQHLGDGFDKAVGWMEVIGIVADTRETGLGADTQNEFYIPVALHAPQTAYLAARTSGDPLGFVSALRQEVWAIDPNQSVSEVKTMDAVLDATLGQRRVAMVLLASFAGVALLLAMIGIYGVIAYSVAQRTQEVGIRRALGAQHGEILLLVMTQALGLTAAGVAIGIGGALALTRVMSGLLFEVRANDPATFSTIALIFLAVALLAAYFPARRAARIDPMEALR